MSVVIICDQPAELESMKSLAVRQGLGKVYSFTHPVLALDWCARHPPELVIIDFLLRANNGIEVIRELRALPGMQRIPLVLMVPHGFESVTAEAHRQGATDFLSKPVDPTEFIVRTRNMLALSAAADTVERTQTEWRNPAPRAAEPSALH